MNPLRTNCRQRPTAWLVAGWLGTLGLVGCQTPLPPAPAPPNVAEIPTSNRLRVGDDLQIRLDSSGSPQTGSTWPQVLNVTISENGDIALPLIGRLPAAGLTPSDLAEHIEANYVPRFYIHCTATVQVAARFFYVGGEVRGSGKFNWSEDMTLLRAINAAGSFTDYANRRKVEITRSKERIVVDCEDLRKHPDRDIPLRPGDSIWVPRSIF